MPAAVLTLAKVAFLVVLFAFIAWSLRVVIRELRESAEGAGAAPDLTLARPAELEVKEPPEHRGTRIPLVHGLTIGRSDAANLQLDDAYVSGTHAVITARGDDFFVTDESSSNGTYVNRRRIGGATLLRRGDTVQIGRTVLEVVK
ncbi:MAG: FHA domain-containing protein [Acidimicrobiia bacterium]|nr:FHA domain-containing protein [Acidimicrobiia bacterium]